MEKAVCFIGHRKIEDTIELRTALANTLENLIENHGIENFLFGDKSEFNSLCYDMVSEMQKEYPYIRRIKYRKDTPVIDEYSKPLFTKGYEDSICPEGVEKAGKASYIKRNQAMIDASEICIFYNKEDYLPEKRKISKAAVNTYQPKSGTKIAYDYAMKQGKEIVNLCNLVE